MNELEFVFQKIIEIDNKVMKVQSDTKKTIQEKESALNQDMRDFDDGIVKKTKSELEAKYERAIEKAEEKAGSIQEEADEVCKSMLEKYSAIKDNLTENIAKNIILS